MVYIWRMDPHLYPDFMHLALSEAHAALEESEVPVGALIVFENKIIGRGHNRTAALHDATAHAEIIALTAAYSHFSDWRLENCVLFTTLEPCAMCAGAAVLSRIKTIVYGAKDMRFGGCDTLFQIPSDPRLNHRCQIVGGVLEPEVADLMRLFFRTVREGKEKIN